MLIKMCLICHNSGACNESVERVLFECASAISEDNFWDYLKQVFFLMHLRLSCITEFSVAQRFPSRETDYGCGL